ncbi:MAG: N-acetyl-gamma-glutamyl-phosphate reductase [Bacillaceae bacterium]
MNISIVGGTGYGGLELIRLLRQHPCVSNLSVYGSNENLEGIHSLYPHLQLNTTYEIKEIKIEEMKKSDIVFLATPPGLSKNVTPSLLEGDCRIIDLSGDYRLKDRESYEAWYGKEGAQEKDLRLAIYGLSEWMKEYIVSAKLIANPGCYATAALLGLAPLLQANIVESKGIVVDGKSGVSGAGKGLSALTHFSQVNENLHIYKVNRHQHIPEIEQMMKNWNEGTKPITFSTHLVPMTRGIMTTIYAQAQEEMTAEKLYDYYLHYYEGKHFVRLRPLGVFPATKEVYGSNYCDIGVAYDKRTNMITIVSVIDNLMKGAAGQAVQNMNIMLGINEEIGLEGTPLFP